MSDPLGTITGGALYDGLPLDARSPLVLDKPTRDRIVIRDPTSAPLVRRVLAADELHAWFAAPTRFLIALPHGWTAATIDANLDEDTAWGAFTTRYPALAKQLQPHADTLRAQPHGAYWWELPPYPVERFTLPALAWTHDTALRVAPLPTGAYLLDGITFTTAPTAYLLGVLGSATLSQAAQANGGAQAERAAHMPIPQASSEAQAYIGALAEQLVAQASTRVALEQMVSARILHDLAPAGATAGPVLEQWWALDFAGLLAELARRFNSDVPYRYRETWAAWLATQRLAHEGHTTTITRTQIELDQYVARLSG